MDRMLVFFLQKVWKKKILFGVVFVLSVTIGYVTAVLIPKNYTATATLFPVTSGQDSGLASKYANIAALAGIGLSGLGSDPGRDTAKTVVALLNSRLLIETLVREENLVDRLGKFTAEQQKNLSSEEMFESTVGSVVGRVSYTQDKITGVISVSMTFPDALLAKDLTNRLLSKLDQLLLEKSWTVTKKQTDLLQKQIDSQKSIVDSLQQEMATFQKNTALFDPKAQAGQSIETYTKMVQQKLGLELQLATAKASYSSDNPRITLLTSQIANLEDQILRVRNEVGGDLPSIKSAPDDMLKYQNLARELEIATRIYSGLLTTHAQSKLTDDKDQIFLEVLDAALLPKVASPSTLFVVGVIVFLGQLVTALFVFFRYFFPSMSREPSE